MGQEWLDINAGKKQKLVRKVILIYTLILKVLVKVMIMKMIIYFLNLEFKKRIKINKKVIGYI